MKGTQLPASAQTFLSLRGSVFSPEIKLPAEHTVLKHLLCFPYLWGTERLWSQLLLIECWPREEVSGLYGLFGSSEAVLEWQKGKTRLDRTDERALSFLYSNEPEQSLHRCGHADAWHLVFRFLSAKARERPLDTELGNCFQTMDNAITELP